MVSPPIPRPDVSTDSFQCPECGAMLQWNMTHPPDKEWYLVCPNSDWRDDKDPSIQNVNRSNDE